VTKGVHLDYARTGNVLLVSSLLLVFVVGFLETPDVGLRLFPERFWNGEAQRIESRAVSAKMMLARAEATLEALRLMQKRGLPRLESAPEPDRAALESALKRAEAELLYRKAVMAEMTDGLRRSRRNADAAVCSGDIFIFRSGTTR